ncbi:MAG: NAD(+)/NADH kinase [Candidatus Glassbacteria bacterium]|nr:NAD(+)/NADH kinase [Candidatus Glassbacteria bacterium]
MNIALKANIFHKGAELQLNRCLDHLLGKGVGVWVYRDLVPLIRQRQLPVLDDSGVPPEVSMMIALGGDGTVLSAARLVGESELPIFGVNMGHFGFLTSSSIGEFIGDLDRILAGDYQTEERMVLAAEIIGPGAEERRYTALNDFVLHKGSLTRPIVIDLKAGDELVGVFPADGVIISTPTGSTAYSLSAGGPILFPLMQAVAITPICPHTLAVRPLVVPVEIPITVSERSSHRDVQLTVDGQESCSISEEDTIVIGRASHVTRLVKPFEGSFFFRLRSKLKWGERERN